MPLTIGIIGTGGVAQGNYLPYLAEQEDVSLIYFSRTREKAETCAAEFGGTCVDSIEAVAGAACDTILVLTNEQTRADVLETLIPLKPKRLFFEKPLVAQDGQAHVSEDDFLLARKLMTEAHEQGIETAMIFNYRFFDQVTNAVRVVSEQDFGDPIQVSATTHYCCWSHVIDLVLSLCGPMRDVTAVSGSITHEGAGMEAKDLAGAFICEKGTTGILMGTAGPDFNFPLFEITIGYQRGKVRLSGLDGESEIIDYGGRRIERHVLTPSFSRWDHYKASFAKSLESYLASIRAGFPPPVPGLTGLQELQVEAALKRSAAEKRQVRVQEEFPLS
jgi:predicted dehydrogenase